MWRSIVFPLILLALAWRLPAQEAAAPATEKASAVIGIENAYKITLPLPRLIPADVERKSPIVLRIESSREKDGQIEYDLRYMGLAPGTHDLAKFLKREDGSPAENLPPMPVFIKSLLPENHQGLLEEAQKTPLRIFGSYRALLIVIAVLWLLLLPLIIFWKRPKKIIAPPAPYVPPPTLADHLRPLVQSASTGALDAAAKARLERLLLGYWRKKLDLSDTADPSAAVRTLKAHPEAGKVLRATEDWLHRPPGSFAVDVDSLLRDYQNVAVDAEGIPLERNP